MRTDVKVGLVCVLILIIAVIAYFAMQGKDTTKPKTHVSAINPGTPANGSTATPIKPDAGAFAPPPSTAAGAPSGGTEAALPPAGFAAPALGQTATPYSPYSSTTSPTPRSACSS